MLDLPDRQARRRPSLTPMIDVVFLLLVFFMLAARFGTTQALPMDLVTTGAAEYVGPPRLVTLRPDGLTLNGVSLAADALPGALLDLMQAPSDIILVQPRDGADVQRLIDLVTRLRDAGLTSVAVLETAQ